MNNKRGRTRRQETMIQLELFFQSIPVDVLVAISKRRINPVKMARQELQNRSLDINGRWIGFLSQRLN